MQTRRIGLRAATAAVLFSAVGAFAPPTLAQDGRYLADFDKVWETVRDTHFDPDLNGVDWEAVRDELRPEAAEAESLSEIRGVLMDMLGRLGQSHFVIIPQELDEDLPEAEPIGVDDDGYEHGDHEDDHADHHDEDADDANEDEDDDPTIDDGDGVTGMHVRAVEGELVVVSVDDGSPAADAGVLPGFSILQIRGRDVTARMTAIEEAMGDEPMFQITAWSMFSGRLTGRVGSTIPILFDTPEGQQTIDIKRVVAEGEYVGFGNLPPMRTEFESRWLEPGEMGLSEDTRVGIIRFNVWMMPIRNKVEAAMLEFKDADGVIFDIRGNVGGVGGLAVAVGNFLIDEKVSLGQIEMRADTLQFNTTPVRVTMSGKRLRPFKGRVAILTDGVSASTSELFAGGLQGVGRAKVFGGTTAGAALPAHIEVLPSGDRFMHAIALYRMPDGSIPEGGGVEPDFNVELTRENLRSDGDPVLRVAVTWIQN